MGSRSASDVVPTRLGGRKGDRRHGFSSSSDEGEHLVKRISRTVMWRKTRSAPQQQAKAWSSHPSSASPRCARKWDPQATTEAHSGERGLDKSFASGWSCRQPCIRTRDTAHMQVNSLETWKGRVVEESETDRASTLTDSDR